MGLRRASFKVFLPFALLLLCVSGTTTPALAQNTIKVPTDQPTIQAAINAAHTGDTILVAPGTYFENIDFKGKAITVISSDGAAKTIIDGGAKTSTVIFKTSELRNSVLSGFTVQNGGPNTNPTDNGSGIKIETAAPTIVNNIISANACHGVEVDSGAPLLQANTISGTSALSGYCSFNGSGVLLIGNPYSYQLTGLHTIITGNIIEQNLHAISYDGGGIMIWADEGPIIENNIIRNNATTGQGGAIASYNSIAVTIVQNLITGNSATTIGAAISLHPPEATFGPFIGIIANNTITDNSFSGPSTNTSTDQVAGQVYLEGNLGQYVLVNNIITWQNTLPALVCGTVYNYLSLTPLVIDHNDIYNAQGPAYGGACPDQTGTYGNISANPLFTNPTSGSYNLGSGSPAVDAGNNSVLTLLQTGDATLTKDLSGTNPRLQDTTGKSYPIVDMGAYEAAGTQDANATIITLTPSAYEVTGGANLTLSAKLISANGSPTGSVTFYEDGSQLGGSVIDATGTATYLVPALVPGGHAFVATYSGQGSFTPGISVKLYVLVDKYSTILKVTSSSNPSILNQPVTFTVTVSSPDKFIPSPITLSENLTAYTILATLTPDANGIATFTTSSLAVGTHPILATYTGDAAHASANFTLNQQVINGYPTTTSLTCSPNPATVGQTVNLSSVVTSPNGAPSGSVTFTDGTTPLGTWSVANGSKATLSSAFSIGAHTISATYNPVGSFAPSTSSCTETINGLPTSTTLTASPNPANALQPVTLTATVIGPGGAVPTGTVTFYDGTSPLFTAATLNPNGVASYITTTLTGGTHLLKAVYNGNTTLASSTSPIVSETIQLLPSTTTLSISPGPSAALQPVTATVQVDPMTSAPYASMLCLCTVTVTITGLPLNVAPTYTLPVHNGIATFNFGLGFSAGTYTFTATFSGSGVFSPSKSVSVQQVVVLAPTAISLTGSPNPVTQHQPVNLTAAITAPVSATVNTGLITFFDGATPIASAPFGSTGLTPVGQLSNTSTVTTTNNTLSAGTHLITASYAGSANFLPATSAPLTLIVNPLDYTLTTASPTLSIKTEHHLTTTVTLTSIGSFADFITLACTNLPAYGTCTFDKSTIQLLANGTATAKLTIDTDAVLYYARSQPQPTSHRTLQTTLATLFPIGLLTLAATRRRRHLTLLFLLSTIPATLSLSGCSGKYPASTPPGTYTIQVTSAGNTTGLTHSTPITLTVTQ